MSWILIIEVFILPALALCASLPRPPDTLDDLQRPDILPALLLSSNSSAATSNKSLLNASRFRCDSVRYGDNLNVESCRRVFGYIAPNDTESTFADRSSWQPHNMNLPFRITGGECLGNTGLLHMNIQSKPR